METPLSPPPPASCSSSRAVTLEFKLMNWSYMNFSASVPTSTLVVSLRKRLEERHGLMSDLVMCLGSFAAANELTEDMKTLEEYGVKGAAPGEAPVTLPLLYEFKPRDHDDPLLLHTNFADGESN